MVALDLQVKRAHCWSLSLLNSAFCLWKRQAARTLEQQGHTDNNDDGDDNDEKAKNHNGIDNFVNKKQQQLRKTSLIQKSMTVNEATECVTSVGAAIEMAF
eukprot:5187432-Amphidinium_carterae.1